MHVAIVSPYDPSPSEDTSRKAVRGGVEVSLQRSAEELARRGVDVTVLCTGTQPGTEDRNGVHYVRVRRLATLFRTPLGPIHRHIPPDTDLLHVPATYPTYSDLLPLTARLRGIPCVLDYHFDPHPTGPAMAAAAAAYRWTLGHAMRTATRIIVHSLDYAHASPRLGCTRDDPRLSWVPNGVDATRFRTSTPPGDHVLCVGRLIPYKGVDVLLHAMARVQSRTHAPLLIAGDGPQRDRLKALAWDLGVDATFLGYVPDTDLPRLYASARLTVLPSINGQEAFGMTLLESMASGTPVIASDLPGVREIARLGGHTAPPGDPEGLATTIATALQNDNLPRGPDLADAIAADYDWPRVVDRLQEAYERAQADTTHPHAHTPTKQRRKTRA